MVTTTITESNNQGTYSVSVGDIFIIDPSLESDVSFEIASGQSAPVSFEIQISESNPNEVTLDLEGDDNDLSPTFTIADNVELPEFELDLAGASNALVNAGDGVTINTITSSGDGNDTIILGDNATVLSNIEIGDGDNNVVIGDNALLQGSKALELGDGNDTVSIGSDGTIEDFDVGDGDDEITLGDGNTIESDLTLGSGNNTLVAGDDNVFEEDILGGSDDDIITLGDGNTVGNIETGKGNDTVTTGADLSLQDLDLGSDADVANIGTIDRAGLVGSGSAGLTLDGGGGSATTDLDSLNLDVGWLTDDERARFLDALADAGYVDSDGDGVFSIQEGDPSADPDDDETVEFELEDGTQISLDDWEQIGVICFARGTRILTRAGEVAIEALAVGDDVFTMDNGFQQIRWIGASRVAGVGHLAPIRILSGAFDNDRDVVVSPQHRILIRNPGMEMLFGCSETLTAAKHLVDGVKVVIEEVAEVEYFHILFDCHEIIFAEGMASESFHPGAVALDSMEDATRREIFELFPELETDIAAYGPSARTTLKAYEAHVTAGVKAGKLERARQ